MISIIVAVSENNVIGHKGQIPWHLPRDFKFFKDTTMGHPMVMGRKTFESIGKPLPGRESIVLTRDQNTKYNGCTVIHSVDEILNRNEEIFIIGGSEVYNQFMPLADKIYLTRVHTIVDGDTLFPKINEEWKLVDSESFPKDERNEFDLTFETYERR